MIRKIILASGMALGLLGMNLTASEAKADGLAFSIQGKNFGFGYSNYSPAYYAPVYPSVYVPTYPSYVVPVQQYDVLYRDCGHGPWRIYGTFASHGQAHAVVERLEWRGYDARVNHH